MRSRRATKGKRTNYAAVLDLGSDDSGSEVNEIQDAAADDDFNMEEAPEASDAEEANDRAGDTRSAEAELQEDPEKEPPSTDASAKNTPDDSDESDHDSLNETLTRKGRKLPKRAHVHEVPTYPSDLQGARIYDGALKRHFRGPQMFNLLYGPDQAHIDVFRGMLAKWFDLQVLPAGRVGDEGVMSSPWLSENFEEKSRRWSKIWQDRSRAAKQQRLQKIRPDHVDMFKPQMNQLICMVGRPKAQKQIRTRYGFGQCVAENGQLLVDTAGAAPGPGTAPKAWLLDTGGIPLAIGWAPSTGHKEQFLAVSSVPFSDQEPKTGASADDDPEEKKRGSIQIWSIPCHKTDGSSAILVQSLSFDWGRPKRLQWCPVPSADETSVGLVAILPADGLVRVIEVPKAISGHESYGRHIFHSLAFIPLIFVS